MEAENETTITDFYILGFSDFPHLTIPLFLLFLLLYLITLFGNLIIISTIYLSHHLHTPMYFFLCNLSSLDISYTSVTSPNLLNIFITGHNSISFTGCMTQLYFFVAFGSTEYFLLTAMAYDRYMAICEPLHYSLIISKRLTSMMAAGAWIVGFIGAVPLVSFISTLDFCSSNEINHFYCDLMPLLKLSCSNTTVVQFILFSEGILLTLTCFILTLASYYFIISTILKIHTSEGRSKAFTTCSSHLSTVILFYTVIFCLYMRPSASYSLDQSKGMSVLFVQLKLVDIPDVHTFLQGAAQEVPHYKAPTSLWNQNLGTSIELLF
ncbi:olfactory receptor 5AR1-like [Rhinophrynus dorsalis]